MEPLLIDVPQRWATERLILRCPQPGDGALVHAAQTETLDELRPWMPWAQSEPRLDDAEAYCRRTFANFILREDLVWFVLEPDGGFVGSIGLHRIDWSLRRFELGYWRRTGRGGRGLMTEAAKAVARLAFDRLEAHRVEVRMDDENTASWKLAERAGFTHEAVLRGDSIGPLGNRRSTRVYARVRGIEELLNSGQGEGPAR
jgi:RimJ/RimL family protein N-acetyltransferase